MFASSPRALSERTAELAPARSAAAVNAQIRALWAQAGGSLSHAQQQHYQQLLVEWATAVRADVVEAA